MELTVLAVVAAVIVFGAYPFALLGMSLAYRIAAASAVQQLPGGEPENVERSEGSDRTVWSPVETG